MRVLPVLAALSLTALPLAAQPPKDSPSPPFASKEGRFTAAFPTQPKEEVQKLAVGKEEVAMYTLSTEGKGFAFLVIWNDMPEAARGAPAKAVLDGAVKGASNRGKVVEDKETTFGPAKHPARRIVLDTREGVRFRILIVLRDGRLYQAMAGGTKEFAAGPKAEQFLKSFTLTK